MERDYLLEKDSRIICENENRVYVNQRDVAREDNQRLNLLVEKLYGSKHTFENIDIIGNTYNWGWSKGEGLGKSNLSHLKPPENLSPEPKVFSQTSLDESSSTTADSDSSASNNKSYLSKTSNISLRKMKLRKPPDLFMTKQTRILLDKFSMKIIK